MGEFASLRAHDTAIHDLLEPLERLSAVELTNLGTIWSELLLDQVVGVWTLDGWGELCSSGCASRLILHLEHHNIAVKIQDVLRELLVDCQIVKSEEPLHIKEHVAYMLLWEIFKGVWRRGVFPIFIKPLLVVLRWYRALNTVDYAHESFNQGLSQIMDALLVFWRRIWGDRCHTCLGGSYKCVHCPREERLEGRFTHQADVTNCDNSNSFDVCLHTCVFKDYEQ